MGSNEALLELSENHKGSNSLELTLLSEQNEDVGLLDAKLTTTMHPAFGISVDAIDIGSSILSESYGEEGILIEPSIARAGDVAIWVDMVRKTNLRTDRPVIVLDNAENSELVEQIKKALDYPDFLQTAESSKMTLGELMAMTNKTVIGLTSTAGGLLLLLSSLTPFIHVYSTMAEKQLIEQVGFHQFGFNYQMLDKSQSPAVITARLRESLAEGPFVRKELERFREGLRKQFLESLSELLP